MNKIKLFLENKGHGNPRACVHIHAYALAFSRPAYACFMPTYTYTSMHTHDRVLETMKDKFFCIKMEIWNESRIVLEPFQNIIFSI